MQQVPAGSINRENDRAKPPDHRSAVREARTRPSVTTAKAGVQGNGTSLALDSRLRGNDDST
jgi:hypothetical protein